MIPTTTVPAIPEDNCFDGIDNDIDGLRDCADPDCNGKTDGPCDTGEPVPCAAGTRQCQSGDEVCVPNNQPAESIDAGNCADLLDNDCDGLTDQADPGCQAGGDTGDVSLTGLQAPGRIYVRTNSDTEIQVVVEATGTPWQMATVRLEASSPAGVDVQIDQASITEEMTASGNALTSLDANDRRRKRTTTTTMHDDDDHEQSTTTTIKDEDDNHYDVVTRFVFNATITGTQKGTWAVNWTAKIVSPTTAIQDANPDNDVLTATTQVVVTTSFRQRLRELFTNMLERQ